MVIGVNDAERDAKSSRDGVQGSEAGLAVKLELICLSVHMGRIWRAATLSDKGGPLQRGRPMWPGGRKGETRRTLTASERMIMLERERGSQCGTGSQWRQTG